jgi:hypothetical protein
LAKFRYHKGFQPKNTTISLNITLKNMVL